VNRCATRHALERARDRYGVVMPNAMWRALAESIRDGEQRLIGKVENGRERYAILLLREDGSTVTMRVLYDREGHCIITCLPKPRPSAPPRMASRKRHRKDPMAKRA